MNEPHEPMRMPFGKHRGELLENIPAEYLRWVLLNVETLDPNVEKEIENQLEMREGRGVRR